MKKLIVIILLIMIMVPFKVGASSPVSVSDVNILASEEASIGEMTKVTLKTTLSGVGAGGENDYVIVEVIYGVAFDDQVLLATEMIPEDWQVGLTEISGFNFITNFYDKNYALSSCKDGKYCTSVSMPINFFVKKTSETETKIQVSDLILVYVKSSDLENYLNAFDAGNYDEAANYTEMHIQDINRAKTIKIKQTEVENVQAPPSKMEENKTQAAVSEELQNSIKEEINTNTNTNINVGQNQNSSTTTKTPSPITEKSKNNYLSLLTIEGYDIEFDKEREKYEITTEDDTKTLNIIVQTEDSKATYQITGADDLKDKVKITVTAENKDEKTYTIFINRKSDIEKKNQEQKPKKDIKKELEKILKDTKVQIVGGAVFVLLLITILIIHHNGKKVDKMLDDM